MTEEGYSIPPPKFLVEELSPEGRELLQQILVMQLSPEEAVGAMMEALPKDRVLLWKINEYLRQAYEVEVEHNVEGYRQSQLAQSVFRRASVLEPGSVGDDTTLEAAIRVLERHGEKAPEDLDLDRIEEVPVKDEEE